MSLTQLRDALMNAARYLVRDVIGGTEQGHSSSDSESEDDGLPSQLSPEERRRQRAEGDKLDAELNKDEEDGQLGNEMVFEGEEGKNEDEQTLDLRK